jgi:putative transferase (TIGR04331 family)
MPAGATPHTHLASGPWCFAGREAFFPGWDGAPLPPQTESAKKECVFPIPDDPYPDARSMEREAASANGEVLRLVRILGDEADGPAGIRRSGRYWQMALGPFLLPAVHMLAERQRRVLNLIAAHGREPLRVELLPRKISFSFQTTLDFMVNGIQNVAFNHYVFSRIVEAFLPNGQQRGDETDAIAWRAVYLPPFPLHQAKKKPGGFWSVICLDSLRRFLRNLPFPLCKGFSLGQALFLSLAVIGNTGRLGDRSLDFSLYCAAEFTWHFPAEELIRACLPEELRRGILPATKKRKMEHHGQGGTKTFFHTRLRGMSPAFSQDDAYRLRLAALRESGCRLFSVQHGANYGNLLSVGILPFEYSQHAFFSWGWRTHQGQPANAHPLPHPALTAICGAHRERFPQLILVGTEMSTYTYRLKSRPLAKAMLAYRLGKTLFFHTLMDLLRTQGFIGLSDGVSGGREEKVFLPEYEIGNGQPTRPGASQQGNKTPELLYRPYFTTAGGLEDADYVRRHVPGIGLCMGNLTEQMLGCRLLVLDHYGTSLHMALAADVPTLAFWNRREWGMEAESDTVLDVLQDAGILYTTPEEAARQAASVWENPAPWWQSPPVRHARFLWLERYARVGDRMEQPWKTWELTRRWFSTLKNC